MAVINFALHLNLFLPLVVALALYVCVCGTEMENTAKNEEKKNDEKKKRCDPVLYT